MELIEAYNLSGLVVGLLTFLIIGLFHPLVVKAEFYFGVKSWWLFFIFGLISLVSSVLVSNLFFSILLGVLSFSSFWSILEVFQQRDRVQKGWFPENPKKKKVREEKKVKGE